MVRDALLADIRNGERISPRLSRINFIIFSGDLAHSGKRTSIAPARQHLLDPMLSAAGVTAQRLFPASGQVLGLTRVAAARAEVGTSWQSKRHSRGMGLPMR
jgi:hypothetical protein